MAGKVKCTFESAEKAAGLLELIQVIIRVRYILQQSL